jgi:hypothetical protein
VTLTLGLVLCGAGWPFLSMLYFDYVRRAELLGESVRAGNPGSVLLWVGIALIVLSQIKAVEIAIREGQLNRTP